MSTNRIRYAATTFLLAAGSLVGLAANAEDAQAPVATDAGVEDAGATDANIDGDADAEAPLPAFDATPFPEEKSPKPKKDDWKTAPQVAFSKGSALGSCKAQRIREWIRVKCGSGSLGQIVVRGGNPEDVSFLLDPIAEPDWVFFPPGGEVVFPVRRGDRRLIEWTDIEWGYKGAKSASTGLLISELWLPDEEKPTIIAR